MTRGFRKILRCKEHEPLEIAASELLDENGRFVFFRNVSEKNLFRVEIGPNGVILRFNAFVGLVPISEDIAVLVEPKAPINSIFYLIHRSRSKNFRSIGASRPYDFGPKSAQLPEHLLADSFSKLYHDFNRCGLFRRYVPVRSNKPTGRLLVNQSIATAFSRRSPQRALYESYFLTDDTFENRAIKTALSSVLKSVQNNRSFYDPKVVRDLEKFSRLFAHIHPLDVLNGSVAAEIRRRTGSFPAKHKSYARALWLSFIVLFQREIQIHQIGPATFQSILINMALVFEDFVRAVLKNHLQKMGKEWGADDGNHKPIPLFTDNTKFNTKPDLYVSHRGASVLIVDAKYKPALHAQDRYEILSFMEASGAEDAVLVCPYLGSSPKYELEGTTLTGRRIHILRFDLGSDDIDAEERWLCEQISTRFLLADAPAPAG